MNTFCRVVLAAVPVFIVGCAQMAPGHEKDTDIQCVDRTVTVNHAAAFLAAHPELVKICSGYHLTVQVVPAGRAGLARTEPGAQNAQAQWLRGRSDRRGRIVLQIPEGEGPGTTWKYEITVEGVGTLDPRVRITR